MDRWILTAIDQHFHGVDNLILTSQEKIAYPVQLEFQHPEKAVNPKWKMKTMLKEVKGLHSEVLELGMI
ncbi:putative ABC ATP-binding protein C-terminus (plasmid) [Alkalihalophilus pseudofirmus OF4]|uniref:ABC ATP-binding protein C-terminus n=1 Tax=Alkalihalophilus pseudofirmus (strain ATCC BAA-2126 / JCM 17055 / OF4) TaxID=398511 RepID=D3G1R7_ALKPO|nr:MULTISPECIES: hypothetical protein [Alkalihalophilus]ADC52293.1 putative ABC ATP-binding protein C-terminus [Alkalihalophilus pseudofirmus OF4]MED1603302.1 hypothetical protein [Alkalihalophilus marmarensis]